MKNELLIYLILSEERSDSLPSKVIADCSIRYKMYIPSFYTYTSNSVSPNILKLHFMRAGVLRKLGVSFLLRFDIQHFINPGC